MRSAQFHRVARLCQIFAYRRKDTPCVARSFFGSLSYVRSWVIEGGTHRAQRVISSGRSVMSDLRLQKEAKTVRSAQFPRIAQLCQSFDYRRRHTPCVARSFFGSISYVRSSLIERGTHLAQRVVSSGSSVMSDLCLQKEAHTVRSAQFLQVAQLCQIFAYRRRHTPCVARSFFGSLSYVRSLLIEGDTHRAQRVVSSGRSVISSLIEGKTHREQRVVSSGPSVMLDLRLQNEAHTLRSSQFLRVAQLCQIFAYRRRHTPCVARFSSGGLCRSFAYRARHTPCVARCFLGWLMSEFCLQNQAYTVCSALFPRVAYVR